MLLPLPLLLRPLPLMLPLLLVSAFARVYVFQHCGVVDFYFLR